MTDFLPGFRGRDRYGGYVVLAVDGDDRLVRYDDGREARRSVVLLLSLIHISEPTRPY